MQDTPLGVFVMEKDPGVFLDQTYQIAFKGHVFKN